MMNMLFLFTWQVPFYHTGMHLFTGFPMKSDFSSFISSGVMGIDVMVNKRIGSKFSDLYRQ